MFHKSVMRGEISDAETGKAVEQSEFEKIGANESRITGDNYF